MDDDTIFCVQSCSSFESRLMLCCDYEWGGEDIMILFFNMVILHVTISPPPC